MTENTAVSRWRRKLPLATTSLLDSVISRGGRPAGAWSRLRGPSGWRREAGFGKPALQVLRASSLHPNMTGATAGGGSPAGKAGLVAGGPLR